MATVLEGNAVEGSRPGPSKAKVGEVYPRSLASVEEGWSLRPNGESREVEKVSKWFRTLGVLDGLPQRRLIEDLGCLGVESSERVHCV